MQGLVQNDARISPKSPWCCFFRAVAASSSFEMDSVIEATSHHQQHYDLKSPSSNDKNPRSKERVLRELKPKHARRAPAPAVDPIAEAKTLLMLRKNTLKAKAKNIQISKAALALKIDAALVFLCATGLVIACLQFEVLKLSHDLSCSSKFHIQCAIAIPFFCVSCWIP